MLDKASVPDQCGEGFRQKVEANIVSREDNVRQLVAKVQLGEADAGVCYLTDVTPAIKPNVQEFNIPDDLNTLADYPIATTKGRNMVGGQAFMAYVLSPAGRTFSPSGALSKRSKKGAVSMELSARNQFKGKVTGIITGGVMAEVIVDIGHGMEVVSVITKSSAERLGLKEGSEVTALIKSSEVLLAR